MDQIAQGMDNASSGQVTAARAGDKTGLPAYLGVL